MADERVYFTDSAARRSKMMNRVRGVVQDGVVNEIDSISFKYIFIKIIFETGSVLAIQ